jgi:hypothetical protein
MPPAPSPPRTSSGSWAASSTGASPGRRRPSKRRRPEGWRVKHTINRNSIKVYDKASVLRVETTINNPRQFKVLRVVQTAEGPAGGGARWAKP